MEFHLGIDAHIGRRVNPLRIHTVDDAITVSYPAFPRTSMTHSGLVFNFDDFDIMSIELAATIGIGLKCRFLSAELAAARRGIFLR